MILVVLPEGGGWRTLSTLQKYREGGRRGGGGETGEEMAEDRITTDLPAVRE